MLNRLVGIQEPERHPARVRHVGKDLLDDGDQPGDRVLDLRRVTVEAERISRPRPGSDLMGRLEQLRDPEPLAGRSRHHGNAQLQRQLVRIDRNPVPARFVHEVQEYDDAIGDREDL